jgi:selenocysteine-specific elongation factor
MTKRLHKTLENTKFANCEVIAVSANPNSSAQETQGASSEPTATKSIDIDKLIDKLKELSFLPQRSASGPFLFAIDHCFNIKGQGTVITGTVLNGQVKVNDVS